MDAALLNALENDSLTFDEYMELFNSIVNSDNPSAPYDKPSWLRYTKSNLERTQKILSAMTVNQKLYNLVSEINKDWIWVVLTEPWCGDASWGVPTLYMIAQCNERIQFKLLLRDKHPEIMANYQTAGTDSIPKLICIDANTKEIVGTWGPRPRELQSVVMNIKNLPGLDYREATRALHQWYLDDFTKSTQSDLTSSIKTWLTK